MQIQQGGILVFFHDGAEIHGLRLPMKIVFIESYDFLYGWMVIKNRFKGFLGDNGESCSMLLVPVEKNSCCEHNIAERAETYGNHMFVAYS